MTIELLKNKILHQLKTELWNSDRQGTLEQPPQQSILKALQTVRLLKMQEKGHAQSHLRKSLTLLIRRALPLTQLRRLATYGQPSIQVSLLMKTCTVRNPRTEFKRIPVKLKSQCQLRWRNKRESSLFTASKTDFVVSLSEKLKGQFRIIRTSPSKPVKVACYRKRILKIQGYKWQSLSVRVSLCRIKLPRRQTSIISCSAIGICQANVTLTSS